MSQQITKSVAKCHHLSRKVRMPFALIAELHGLGLKAKDFTRQLRQHESSKRERERETFANTQHHSTPFNMIPPNLASNKTFSPTSWEMVTVVTGDDWRPLTNITDLSAELAELQGEPAERLTAALGRYFCQEVYWSWQISILSVHVYNLYHSYHIYTVPLCTFYIFHIFHVMWGIWRYLGVSGLLADTSCPFLSCHSTWHIVARCHWWSCLGIVVFTFYNAGRCPRNAAVSECLSAWTWTAWTAWTEDDGFGPWKPCALQRCR